MKKPGLFAASVAAAASATAVSASSSSSFLANSYIEFSREESVSPKRSQNSSSQKENSSSQKENSSDKFEPRFDGLRFIETLVTAHR